MHLISEVRKNVRGGIIQKRAFETAEAQKWNAVEPS